MIYASTVQTTIQEIADNVPKCDPALMVDIVPINPLTDRKIISSELN